MKATAKITFPRVRGCYLRKGIHSRIDGLFAQSKVIWVYGPGGAGKTTLFSSYAQQRKRAVLWYRCDETDADVSSFFYYLSNAVENLLDAPARELPVLRPDQDNDPQPFAKRYFRKLGELLNKKTLIVVDDFHAVAETSVVPQTLAGGIEELPEHVHVVVMGRVSPGSPFARLQLHGELALMGLQDLNFSLDEVADLAARYHPGLDHEALRDIYATTQGWVAGTMLLVKGDGGASVRSDLPTPQLIYDYFAQEVFEQLPDEAVALLLKTSMLEDISPAIAEAITGLGNAAMILAELAHNQVFVDRTGEADDWYGCHPLFREFLQRKARAILGEEGLRQAKADAGRALMTSRQSELGANLLLEVQDWPGVKEWLRLNTRFFIESNRNRFVLRVLDAVPETQRRDDYCLAYWRGLAMMALSPTEAGELLERAYRLADKAGDANVAVEAWCSTIESMLLAWDSLERCERWWSEYYRIQERYAKKLGQALSVRLTIFTFVLATAWPKDDKLMGSLAQQVSALYPLLRDPNQQTGVAITLFLYRFYCGDAQGFQDSKSMMQSLLDQGGLSAASRALLHSHLAFTHYVEGEVEAVYGTAQEGLEIAEENQINLQKVLLYLSASYAAALREDADKMGEMIRNCQQIPLHSRRLDLAHLYCHQGFRAAILEDLETAYDYVMKASESSANLQVAVQRSHGNSLRSFVCAAMGRFDEAELFLKENEHLVEEIFKSANRLRMVNHVTAAWVAFCRQDWDSCEQWLRSGFNLGMQHDIRLWLYFWPRAVGQLCSFALQRNVYRQFTRSLIRAAQLPPPAGAVMPDQWDYELEIRVLGEFEIRRNGRALSLSRYRKPLELLKALIAFGARQVNEALLIDALWPDADGDTAHRSFATNLHRLRKLLGQDSLVLAEGKLSLKLETIWVDSIAFEGLIRQWEQAKTELSASADSLLDFSRRLQSLYAGTLLNLDEQPWVFACRERQRNRYFRVVSAISEGLTGHGHCPDAVELLEQALDREPGIEALYQALLKGYQREARSAAAALLFERCCRELASHGKQVSAETERLYRALQKPN